MLVSYLASRNIYYGWVVIGTMFLTMFLVLGVRFSFGIFYVAILADTGWQRAETALIFSIAMFVYSITILLSGYLFDKIGPRRLFSAAAVLLGLGFVLCSTIQSIGQFYLYYGVIIGIAFSMLGFPTHMAVVPRWFQRKRGLAAGLALSGIGFGSIGITLLSEYLILSIGWRQTYLVYGIAMTALLVPLNLLFHRESPQAIGLNPDGDPVRHDDPGPTATPAGLTFWEAFSTMEFWLLFFAITMVGFVTMTLLVHQTRLTMDFGYPLSVAAFFFGLTGLIRSLGQFTWGAMSDRFGHNPIFVTATVMGVAGLAILYFTQATPNLVFISLFTLLLSFGFLGISSVYASIVSSIFQGRHMGRIFGILDIGFGTGAFSGPLLAGYLFDILGNYDITMALLALAMILCGTTLYLISRVRPKPAP